MLELLQANLMYERLCFQLQRWQLSQVMMQSLEYPFLAGKWSLIPNVATIIRALITAKKHQQLQALGTLQDQHCIDR